MTVIIRNLCTNLFVVGISLLIASEELCAQVYNRSSVDRVPSPIIISHPANLAVTVGESATFSVTASGFEPFTYQWKRGKSTIAGATSSVYTIPVTVLTDSGMKFRCAVSNSHGAVLSNEATLIVRNGVPAIVVQPQSQTVDEGQTVTMAASVSGSQPLLYRWQRNRANITGATNASYEFAAAMTDSGLGFRCVVSNSLGTVTSSSAILTVRRTPIPPQIVSEPQSQTSLEGDSARFVVIATGTAPLLYRWQLNGENIPGATSDSYTRRALTFADNGLQFRCIVWNAVGADTSEFATLTVNARARITVQPSPTTVAVGQAAQFDIGASGTPPLAYQWQRNGVNIEGATGASYVTLPTVQTDSGSLFRCIASNGFGADTSIEARLSVTSLLPTISTQPVDATAFAGHSAVFLVVADGATPLQYQWHMGGVSIIGATNSYYATPPATQVDSGASFTCVVSNSLGSVVSDSAFLTVLPTAPPLSDDFSGSVLNTSLWTIVNPQGDAAFALTGSGTSNALLSIDIPGGVSHDLWVRNQAPRLLQPVQDTDFEIETKIQSEFTAQYQMQGMLVQQDSLNIMRFDVAYHDSSMHAFLGIITDGVPTMIIDDAIPYGNPLYLKVRREQHQWTMSYSNDGVQWTQVVTFFNSIAVNTVGLFAGNFAEPEEFSPPFTALFDYVFNTAAPTIPEDPVFPPLRPLIVAHPSHTTTGDGQAFAFAVTADGSLPLRYQWQKNGVDIPGATTATYGAIASITDSGSVFRCIVRNFCGVAASNTAILSVVGIPPTIVSHPTSRTVLLGRATNFSVSAIGTTPLMYQWQKDQIGIDGATNATYTTPPTTAKDSGSVFNCEVWNPYGAVVSDDAVLHVQTSLKGVMRFTNIIVDENNPRHTHCKAVGDVDGDGHVDIFAASARGYTDGLFWYHYPTWSKYKIHEGTFSTFMQAADIDGDGDLDAVIPKGDDLGATIWWYENPRPLGNPASDEWVEHYIGSGIAHDLEVADLNGDGRLDVVGRYSDASIFLQVQPGVWQPVLVGGRWAEGTALADLDGDGDIDILNGGWWLQNPLPKGDITDPEAWNHIIFDDNWEAQIGVGAADLNGDGRTDVLLAPSHNMEQLGLYWYEQPDSVSGEWIKHAVDTTVNNIHNVETADMNNDGQIDIVIAEMYFSQDPDEVNIYLGDGTGNHWTKNTIDLHGSHSLYIGDIGNDGDLDIIGANADEEAPDASPVEIWENLLVQPTLSMDLWERHVIDSTRDWQSLFISAADLDRDKKLDIITGGWWYRQPALLSDPWTRDTIGSPLYNMALVFDFDNDGKIDILGTQGQGPQSNADFVWAKNSGDGHFAILNNIDPGQGDFLQGAAIRRFGIDTPFEVALSWDDKASGVQMLTIPEDPVAAQWSWRLLSSTSQGEQLTAKDIDRDRNIDLLLGTQWLKNEGEIGTYAPYVLHPGGDLEPDRSRLADINGDDHIDAVVGYEAIDLPGKLAWYEQSASPIGLWTEHVISASLIGPMSVDAADIDHDGDVDVIVGEHYPAHPDSARLIVFENADNIGTLWLPHVVYTGDEHHDGAQVVDIDGDGDFDIISISWSNGNTLLYENKAIDSSGAGKRKVSVAKSGASTTENDLPKVFALYQNYPNPFNPSTTLRYDVPVDGKILLQVFNILGQEVATMVNEEQKAGRYSVRFDATRFASGVYFYRMHADGFMQARKMIVVK